MESRSVLQPFKSTCETHQKSHAEDMRKLANLKVISEKHEAAAKPVRALSTYNELLELLDSLLLGDQCQQDVCLDDQTARYFADTYAGLGRVFYELEEPAAAKEHLALAFQIYDQIGDVEKHDAAKKLWESVLVEEKPTLKPVVKSNPAFGFDPDHNFFAATRVNVADEQLLTLPRAEL